MHKDLFAYQLALELAEWIYRCTADFPKSEMFGLTSQMRRAAVSVPSNISEGAGRYGPAEFRKYLYIARGSLAELETQTIIAQRVGYLDEIPFANSFRSLERLLNGLIRQQTEKITSGK